MCAALVACLFVTAAAVGALLWPREPLHNPTRKVSGPTKHDETASGRLVSLIDMLFALVIALPVVIAEDVIRAPWDANLPVVIALATGYYVVIRSFIDWHIAMEDAPYWIRTSPQKSWELKRVYVDFAIVMAYAMLFLSTKDLATRPGSEIGPFLFLLGAITLLYLAWGALRWFTYRAEHEYRWHTLFEATVGFIALWGAYRIEHDHGLLLEGHGTTRNSLALALALVVLLAYRLRNWREIRHVRSLATADATETVPGEVETAGQP